MKEIKLDDILIKMVEKGKLFYNEEDIKNAMREACKQTLELAAEKIRTRTYKDGNTECFIDSKQSILDLINQIK